MNKKGKIIVLPCDCRCCMFVVEKIVWEDGDVAYNISIQDSRYDHDYNTLWGRIKRAARTLFGRPISYSDLYLDGEETFQKLVKDMDELSKADLMGA